MSDLPPGYVINKAVAADVPAMIAADRAASVLFEPTGLLEPSALHDTVPADVFKHALPLGHVHVARNESKTPIGFTLTSERSGTLYLDQISVDPTYGKQGIGRALLIRVIQDAEDRSLPNVTLSTFRDLPWNGPFYASMGFKEIARPKLEPFMLEIEQAQRDFMDVSHRCFMRRKVRRPLFRFRRTA